MDPIQHKIYHEDDFHSRNYLNTYYGNKANETACEDVDFKPPMEQLHYFFKFAKIKGGLLIDIAIGPMLYHLYSACEYFDDIIVLKFNDHCILELKKWLHNDPGAFDWKQAALFVSGKEGRSAKCEEKDQRLKTSIKHVLKCYTDKENITDPLQIPQADCLLIKEVLDAISKDKDDFIRMFRQFSKLLKPGGQLIFFGFLNATFYMVDGEKFHLFNYDEGFLRGALEGEGYSIDFCEVRPRETESDLIDFKARIFVTAHKNQHM